MKVNQRISLTRRLLKEGLLRLLEEKTLDKISVSELCSESGINRTTFYRHYGMPRDVLIEIHEDFIDDISKKTDLYLSSDNIDVRFEKLNAFLLHNAQLLRVFMRYLPEEEITRSFEILHKNALQNTDRGKRLESLDDLSRRLVYAYHAGGSFFLMRTLLREDRIVTSEEFSAIRRHLHQ